MTTAELANFIAPYLAPAKRIVDALPAGHLQGKTGTQNLELAKAERQGLRTLVLAPTVTDFTSPATKASLAALEIKFAAPSKRTYYLGRCGRVSQRKQLVGELVATVRACNTDQARYLFSAYETMRTYPVSVPKPFIGKPVLCKCGWHHSHTAECPVCANWKHIGQMMLDGTAEA